MDKKSCERNAFQTMTREMNFLLSFPFLTIECAVLARLFIPGFIPEITVLITATVVSLIIANRYNVYHGDEKSIRSLSGENFPVLRNIFIGITFVFASAILTEFYNPNKNVVNSNVWIVLISLLVIISTIFLPLIWKEDRMNRKQKIINLLIFTGTISSITYLLVQSYVNFNTQFIWVPLVGLSLILGILYSGKESYTNSKYSFPGMQLFKDFLIPCPLGIGLISTFSQFWFTSIFGVPLWGILLFVVIATVIFTVSLIVIIKIQEISHSAIDIIYSLIITGLSIVLYFFWNSEIMGFAVWKIFIFISILSISIFTFRYIIKRKRRKVVEAIEVKKKEEDAKQRKEEDEKRKKEIQESIDRIIKSVKGGNYQWKDLLFLSAHRNILDFNEITSKIHRFSLEQLISISDTKQQIFWNDTLEHGLVIINNVFRLSRKDEDLKLIILEVQRFIDLIVEKKNYIGYEYLVRVIKKLCPDILPFLKI